MFLEELNVRFGFLLTCVIALSEGKGSLLEQEIAPWKGSSQERCEILVSHEMQCLVEL